MIPSLTLLLDLGDVLTKGVALRPGRRSHRFLFPSVVAHQLLQKDVETDSLLLDDHEAMLRLGDFDPKRFPRTRSYPREESLRRAIPPAPGARYAGRIAVALGADRELLGRHPSEENIDALVHKSFFKTAAGCRRAEVCFVVDLGAKADALSRYAKAAPREVGFLQWKVGQPRPALVNLTAHGRVVDAATCAAAAIPAEIAPARIRRLLLLDIGYLRTKCAVLSAEGCEHQEQVEGLGVSDCVRRILRDEQEHGLVEDEYAVIRALELSRSTLQVAGRNFAIGPTVESARAELLELLLRAVQRIITEDFKRRGAMCRAVAVVGGGAGLVGEDLAARLKRSDLGLQTVWVANDTRFFLLQGAERLQRV